MGFPYNELIPAATLFSNPGITREEFVRLLDETHSMPHVECSRDKPWGYYNPEYDDARYHQGTYGLARILRLEETRKYKAFRKGKKDKNGILVKGPSLDGRHLFVGKPSGFEVAVQEENILGPPVVRNEYTWERERLKVGKVWEEDFKESLVTKIFEEEKSPEGEGEVDGIPFPRYRYRVEVRPIQRKFRIEKYQTEEELYRAWPQFHPDFVFDWAQERGHLSAGIFGHDDFLWIRKGDRYFLDEETFNRIPASFLLRDGPGYGYVDLILTAGAIRHKAWKILSYRGLVHREDFLFDFPDAKQEYEKAVWDAHTSLWAKQEGKTVQELLRFRCDAYVQSGVSDLQLQLQQPVQLKP